MARKKWRIASPCTTAPFGSEAELAVFVDSLRDGWADGGSVSAVTIQVDEGLGFGWQDYEHVDFTEEAS